jgi:hypothetical protein
MTPDVPNAWVSGTESELSHHSVSVTATPGAVQRLIDNTDVPASLRSDHDGLEEPITMVRTK